MVDGKAVLRMDWDTLLYSHHVVVFIDINAFPQGGGGGSNPLKMLATLAVMAFAVWAGPWAAGYLGFAPGGLMGAALTGAAMFGGMALVNLAMPAATTSVSSSRTPAASPTYSIESQGNYARIDQAIPEHFGRHEVFFDFAATPYSEAHGNEIYLYQLFVATRGECDVEVLKIEDTPISNFEEIQYEIIPPGGSVSLFPANVVPNEEVSGQKLEYNVYSNVAVSVPEGQQAEYLGYDLLAPKGIFYTNDNGSLSSQTITADLEYQEIDDDGVAIGSWVIGRQVSYSAATTTPQRYSEKVPVPAGRYQSRVKRTNVEQTDTRYGHELDWAGLRAYINDDRQYGDVTLIAMIMRASSQLSSQASRKVNGIITRKLYVWENGGWSATKQPTKSIAWAAAYICQQIGLSDTQYDLQQLIYLDGIWKDRGDECNGRIDSFYSFREALNKIVSAGRCKAYEQGGIVRFWRDQQETMAVCHFSMLNIVSGSFGIQLLMPTTDTADTVDTWYYDEAVWKRRKVRCTLPDSSAETPAKLETSFITKRAQATREGIYTAATNRYRREIVSFTTEMEGFIPSLGDLISIQHDMPAWGQSGEAIAVSQAENLLFNSEDFTLWTLNGVRPFGSGSVANAAVAPDGKTTADFISEDTSNSSHRVSVALAFDLNDNDVGTFSFFVKKGTRSAVFPWMLLKDGSFAYGDLVNLNDGSLEHYGSTAGYVTTAEEYPDGWWRVSISGSIGTGVGAYPRFYISISNSTLFRVYYGDGSSGIYVWGMQFNAGSSMVEYLKTTSSEVSKTVLTTSEPLTWDDELQHCIGLRKKDGSLFGPVPVTRALSADNLLIIDDPIPFEIYTGSDYERTHYAFGWADTWSQYAKVRALKPRDGYRVDIEAFTEDSNVHTAEDGITVPSVQTSQLSGYQTRPIIEGLIGKSMPGDVDLMLLSWKPSPWAEFYLIEQSADGITWTRTGETGTANYTARAIYGSATLIRVCAVGMTTGPWVQIGFGSVGDYMWNADDSVLMWNADDTTLMWS